MTRLVKRPRASHAEVAAAAVAAPGEWVRVGAYRLRANAVGVASAIRSGRQGYAPAGGFETRLVDGEFDTEIFVRVPVGGEGS